MEELADPKQKMKEWVEKNGLPKVIYVHPDDLEDLKSWRGDGSPLFPSSIRLQICSYLQKGEFIFSVEEEKGLFVDIDYGPIEYPELKLSLWNQ